MGSCIQSSAMSPISQNDDDWNKSLADDAKDDRQIKKLLLLGPGNSGKSTFFKQLLQIHGDGFNDPKRFAHANITRAIFLCIIVQLKRIIRQCEEFEYTLPDDVQESADFVSELPRDVVIDETIARHIKRLWAEPSVVEAFEQRSNLGIVDSCPHFFASMDRVCHRDYVPTEQDMLLVRTSTTGVHSSRLSVDQHHFLLLDMGGQRSERNKWIHCFDSVTAVLFVASLSCYDQALFELDYVNAMQEALNLFDEICNSRWFKRTSLILFLNKSDLFRLKIGKKDLRRCFPDYEGPNTFQEGR